MKKVVLFVAMMTIMLGLAFGENENVAGVEYVSAGAAFSVDSNDGDVDLYLDCFENAVKGKDMELAAKIANVLYGMDMSNGQRNRFLSIENMISKKDYRVYRAYLNDFTSKSMTVDYGADDGIAPYYENSEDGAFFDEIIDSFYSFFDDLGAMDSTVLHYERHDTIDGGGVVDVFVDTFGKYLFDDNGDTEMRSKRSDADARELDALLDDYENYVGLSVDALKRIMSGDEAALKDFEEYSHKASSVSEKLGRLSNAMTSKQFKRYLHILGNMVTGMF